MERTLHPDNELFFKLTLDSSFAVTGTAVSVNDFENVAALEGLKASEIFHPDYQSYVPLKLSELKEHDVFSDHLLFGKVEGIYHYLKMDAVFDGKNYNLSFFRSEYLQEPEILSGNENLSLLTENYLGAFYRTDRFSNLIYISTKIKDLLGYKPPELIGGNLRREFFLSSEKYDSFRKTMLETGRLADIEASLKHKEGRIVWLRCSSVGVYDEKGEYFGTAGYVRDVTEQKTNTEELSHMKRLLDMKQKELDSLKMSLKYQVQSEVTKGRKAEETILYHARLAEMGEMVGSIAHQWRQPLSALMFLIEDIRDAYHFGELDVPYLDDSIKECMSYIRFMSDTMDDFRNFFRPEPEKEQFNLTEKLIEVVKMQYGRFEIGAVNVKIKSDLSVVKGENTDVLHIEYGKGIRVFYDKPLISGGVVIYGYPNLFKQVIINLINNSIDSIMDKRTKGDMTATEHGKILITIKVLERKVSIDIEDNGTGIEDNILSKIFEPEYTTKPKNKGTGIGLHMARSIVEKSLNGKITAGNSTSGAVFTITLPRITHSKNAEVL